MTDTKGSARAVDVVVVGAGPVGAGTAARLLGAGLKVALVEFHLVGGECGNYACIPLVLSFA